MNPEAEIKREEFDRERRSLLEQIEDWLETPLLVLGFIWLGLLVIELVGNLSPALELLGTFIWIVFILDFALKFCFSARQTRLLEIELANCARLARSGAARVSHLSRRARFASDARRARASPRARGHVA